MQTKYGVAKNTFSAAWVRNKQKSLDLLEKSGSNK